MLSFREYVAEARKPLTDADIERASAHAILRRYCTSGKSNLSRKGSLSLIRAVAESQSDRLTHEDVQRLIALLDRLLKSN